MMPASRKLHRVLIVFMTVGALACTAIALPLDGQRITHWLVIQTKTQRIAINPVSKEKQALSFKPNRIEVNSPDGSHCALILNASEGALEAGLHIADIVPDGSQRNHRLLVPGSEKPHEVSWLPDSSAIVLTHGSTWHTQVYMIEIDEREERAKQQSKISEVRLSDGKDRANKPAVSSDGTIAWLAQRDLQNKRAYIDLMIVSKLGEHPQALIERENIHAFAFSPDGRQIAYCANGKLTIIDASNRKVISEREYHPVDERLYAHHARKLVWSPDGRVIAAILKFSGGRAAMPGGEPPLIFGDREAFIIPIAADEKTSVFTLDEETLEVSWIPTSALPKPAP